MDAVDEMKSENEAENRG